MLQLGDVELDGKAESSPRFILADNGYRQDVSYVTGDGSVPPFVTDVITVYAMADTADGLANLMQTLVDEQRKAAWWRDSAVSWQKVWLTKQLLGESHPGRSFVRSIEIKSSVSPFAQPASDGWGPIEVVVHRHPYWEMGGLNPQISFEWVNFQTGGMYVYDYTWDSGASIRRPIKGDAPGRIKNLSFGTSEAPRIWAGFRSEKLLAASFFDAWADLLVWELEDGTNGTDAADVADGTASGGSKVRITESGLNWDDEEHQCSVITAGDVATAAGHSGAGGVLYGWSVWLLRAKVSAGTWRVYAKWGYDAGADQSYHAGNAIEINSTDWDFFNLGAAQFPPRNAKAPDFEGLGLGYDENGAVQIWAERTSGAGTLDLDCLCLVPCDEGYLQIESADDAAGVLYRQSADDSDSAFVATSYKITDMVPYHAVNFRVPPDEGRLFIVFAGATVSNLATDTIIPGGSYVPRWILTVGDRDD